MHFDARAVKALQPGGHIVVHGCLGLRLEASATRKTWIYRYRSAIDSKLRQIKIGGWPAMPVGEAVARWQELRMVRDQGRDPAMEKRAARKAPGAFPKPGYTLGELVGDYAAKYLTINREPRGAKAVAARLRRVMEPYASLPVSVATRAFVFDRLQELLDTPVLARSIKAEMAAAWRFAQEAGRVDGDAPNWWAEKTSHRLRSKGALREGRHKGTDKRVLREDEIRVLVREDLQRFSQQVRDFLTLQLWTCTRGAEICRMRREQVRQGDGGQWWWTIPKSALKTGYVQSAHDLRVPLVGRALEVVQRLLLQPGDIMFSSTGRDGTVKEQSQAYMQSKVHYLQPYSNSRPDHQRVRLKVTHWSPHDLRRTGRTMLAAMGCPHDVGEAILGHTIPGVAGDYNRYRYDAERVQWLSTLSDRLEAVVRSGV